MVLNGLEVDSGVASGGLWRAVAVMLLVLTVLMVSAAPGEAHSQEVASDPADKSQVQVVPAAVTMTFNENVLGVGTRIQVTGPDGDVDEGATQVTNNIVRQAVSPDAKAGRYVVLWKVTSADGHPVSGQFTFVAASGSSAASTAQATPGSTAAPVSAGPAKTSGSGAGSGGGMSGLSVIAAGVVVLALLLGLGTAAGRIVRGRARR